MTHVYFDGRTALTFDRPSLERLVSDLAELSGLKVILGPVSAEYATKRQAICIIAESHISVELDVVSGAFWLDVLSCRPVPPCLGRRVFEVLRPERWKLGMLPRGRLPPEPDG